MCPALGLTRDEARWELPLHEGLAQLHVSRLAQGVPMVWPEEMEREGRVLEARIRASFGA